MKQIIYRLIIIGVILMTISLTFGCSATIEQYKNTEPKLKLEAYLNGRIEGSGIIQDWKGKVTKRFSFLANASWSQGIGTLDEKMVYYDGKTDHRIWTIKRVNDHYYEATTKDLVGIAKIYVEGNAMNWQYQMNITVDQATYKITFDDWMFLMHDGVLINKNQFSKFGFNVGSLTLMMQKKQTPSMDNGAVDEK
ncbi:DUF3833 domain-containing protein [Thiotrichales bacterium 19S3-7]|nr:DUF3833 domain-containing protein [Thiotrichales bacterium 19S3-7]MCF6800637.1 DUF3833 domain-containing protein [Thiotrichales bacterium 19S3-11]